MRLSEQIQNGLKGIFDATKQVVEKHGFFSIFKNDLTDTARAISVLNFFKPKLYDLEISAPLYDETSIFDEKYCSQQSIQMLKITSALRELSELPRLTESDARKAEVQIRKCLNSFEDKFKDLIKLDNQCKESTRTLATILANDTFKNGYMMMKNKDFTVIISPAVQLEKIYDRDLTLPAVVVIDNTMKVTQYPTFENFELMTNSRLTTIDKLQDIWEISEAQNQKLGKTTEDRIWDEVFALKERNQETYQKLTGEVKDLSKDIQAYRQDIKEARRQTVENHRGERYFMKDERFIIENFNDFYKKYEAQVERMVLLSEKSYTTSVFTQYCPDTKDWIFTMSFTDEHGKTINVEVDKDMNVEKITNKNFPIDIEEKNNETVYDRETDEVNYTFAMNRDNRQMLSDIPVVKEIMFPKEKEMTTQEKAESISRELKDIERD